MVQGARRRPNVGGVGRTDPVPFRLVVRPNTPVGAVSRRQRALPLGLELRGDTFVALDERHHVLKLERRASQPLRAQRLAFDPGSVVEQESACGRSARDGDGRHGDQHPGESLLVSGEPCPAQTRPRMPLRQRPRPPDAKPYRR